ncbi:MAG TPA: hypothetical protein VII72_05445 [Myxococcota bacterium]
MSAIRRSIAIWALILALASVSVAAFLRIYRDMQSNLKSDQSLVLGYELPRLSDCIAGLPAGLAADTSQATTTCYDRLYLQGLLNDFQTRRAKFAMQQSSDLVILWMVVSLTLSGVVLAGLQLGAAYRLARAGQAFSSEGEFAIEQGKVVFRSSMAGLFILLFSFAFFYVYIREVYTIHEVDLNRAGETESLGEGYGPKLQPVIDRSVDVPPPGPPASGGSPADERIRTRRPAR